MYQTVRDAVMITSLMLIAATCGNLNETIEQKELFPSCELEVIK